MKKQRRKSRAGLVIALAVCILLVLAALRFVNTGLEKLKQYGSSTAVTVKDEPKEEPVLETPTSVEPEPGLPKNAYDPDGFYTENGLIRYEDDHVIGVAGIDVSVHQQDIDWKAVKAAGVDFAIIQLGYRGYKTGELELDACFEKNMQGAAEAGIERGVYFFSQALDVQEAEAEARFVIDHLQDHELSYPVIFDWELVNESARTEDMQLVQLTNCALAFCQMIEEAGYEAGIYFNQLYGYQWINLPSLEAYEFWLAEYAEVPTFHYDFGMWQYTDKGSLPGIAGNVDLNVAFHKK